jgi:hypothetical protein
VLFGRDPGHVEAVQFAKALYERLNKATKVDPVLDALAEKIDPAWVERGFFPRDVVLEETMGGADGATPVGEVVDLPVARELGLTKSADFFKFLKKHGVISKVEPRKVPGLRSPLPGVEPVPDRSTRCAILTAEAQKRLAQRQAARSTTTP